MVITCSRPKLNRILILAGVQYGDSVSGSAKTPSGAYAKMGMDVSEFSVSSVVCSFWHISEFSTIW